MYDGPGDPRTAEWFRSRTFGRDHLDAQDVTAGLRERGTSISVCLPALNEAATIGAICEAIRRTLMDGHGLVSELIVVDSGSSDATAAVARSAGARVISARSLPPAVPGGGKGEALWKSVIASSGDVIVWLDSDVTEFDPRVVPALAAPLLDPAIAFVKAFYERPAPAGAPADGRGARITELVVRPLLNLLYPALSGVIQPLAGECAGRRDVLERVPFLTGYAVDVCLLIDIVETMGLDSVAQVDVGTHVHRKRDLLALGRASHEILHGMLRTLHRAEKIEMPAESSEALIQFERRAGAYRPVETHAAVTELPPIAAAAV